MKVPRLAVLLAVAVAATPASAMAQDVAPPGNSAVDQYRESAPPTSSNSKKLSKKRKKALEAKGKDGAALAAALDRNGGVPTGGSGAGETGAGAGGSSAADSGGGGSGRTSGDIGAPSGTGGSGAGGGAGTAGPGGSAPSDADASSKTTSTTQAAASSTVGPIPVWGMVVAAFLVVGVGLVIRRRTAT